MWQQWIFTFFHWYIIWLTVKPHNPMINAGSILICSLLKTLVEPDMTLAEKFDFTLEMFKVRIRQCLEIIYWVLTSWFLFNYRKCRAVRRSALTMPSFCRNVKQPIVIMHWASICVRTSASRRRPIWGSAWTSTSRYRNFSLPFEISFNFTYSSTNEITNLPIF